MTMKDEIKASLITNMESALDPFMAEHSFTRGNRSLVYKRQLQGATQSIDVTLQIHPKDRPSSSAAVYPLMEVFVPAVDTVLKDMIGDNLDLMEGVTGGTSKQPIEFTSNKAEDARWFVYQPDSVPGVIKDMREFIDRWTMPFLDVYATPEDIIATDERNDGRLPRDRAQMMRVVAAALVCHRTNYATAVMEKWLGGLGARRRYQQVYDYIQQAA